MYVQLRLASAFSDFRVLIPSPFTLIIPPTWRRVFVPSSMTSLHLVHFNSRIKSILKFTMFFSALSRRLLQFLHFCQITNVQMLSCFQILYSLSHFLMPVHSICTGKTNLTIFAAFLLPALVSIDTQINLDIHCKP